MGRGDGPWLEPYWKHEDRRSRGGFECAPWVAAQPLHSRKVWFELWGFAHISVHLVRWQCCFFAVGTTIRMTGNGRPCTQRPKGSNFHVLNHFFVSSFFYRHRIYMLFVSALPNAKSNQPFLFSSGYLPNRNAK